MRTPDRSKTFTVLPVRMSLGLYNGLALLAEAQETNRCALVRTLILKELELRRAQRGEPVRGR